MRSTAPLIGHVLELARYLPPGSEVFAYTDDEVTIVVGIGATRMVVLEYGPGDEAPRAVGQAEYHPLRGLSRSGDPDLVLEGARARAGTPERPVPLVVERVLERGSDERRSRPAPGREPAALLAG